MISFSNKAARDAGARQNNPAWPRRPHHPPHGFAPRNAKRYVEPRGSPGVLQGHADAVPVAHFCAAAPVHIPAAVDIRAVDGMIGPVYDSDSCDSCDSSRFTIRT